MKHFFRIFLFTLLMSLLSMVSLGCGWAFAAPPSESIHTPHFQLGPVSASSAPSVKVAGIYWLPDYLKDNLNRDDGDPEPPQPTPPPSGECETYKLTTPSTVDLTRYQCDTVFVHETLSCYDKCRCKPTRNPGSGEHCILWCENNCIDTACDAPVALTYPNDRCTVRCAQNNTVCTAKTCDSYCSGNASRSCSGAYTGSDGCGGSCYQCCSDTCSTGSTSSYCPSNQISYANGSETECGSTCYSCRDKTCADGGYKASIPTGSTCSTVSYAGKTCYTGCVCDNTCSSGSTSSSCGTNEIAYSVGSTKCGNTCYSCRAKTCDDGGYKSSTGGMVCTSVSYAGNTCYKDCVCDNTCSSGSTSSSCGANEIAYSVGSTKCGNTCYSCRAKTCDDGGYKSSTGGMVCTSVSYAGKTCYKDCQCDDSCTSGTKTACTASQVQVSTSKTACGSTCYVCKEKNVPCKSPYSAAVKTCNSPDKLVTQSDNTGCGLCVNQCQNYSRSVECMDKTYIMNNSGYGDEIYNILHELGQPAMQEEISCSYDKNYKACQNNCDNIRTFINRMSSSMKRTLCSIYNQGGANDSWYSLCDNFGGIDFLATDYNVYKRLLDEGACGITVDENIRSCRALMDASKNHVSGC